MGLHETEAFVLRTYKLAEADKIVILLTQNFGLLRGVARGARKLKSRFGASLELFTLISLTYHEKEARELVSISQTEIVSSYFHLAQQAELVETLNYLSELLIEFVPPHAPDEKLFRLVKACLAALASAPTDYAELTRYFELWLLKLAGFLPDVRTCANCRRPLTGPTHFGPNVGLQCADCAHGIGPALAHETQMLLQTAMRSTPSNWAHKARTAATSTRQELSQFTQQLIARALERTPRSQGHAR
jgi:DNA repair protein RecO (recombination protein O)